MKLSVKSAVVHESYRHLRRERILVQSGCYMKSNPKYAESAAELLGLTGSKPVEMPLAAKDRRHSGLNSPALGEEQHRLLRRVVGALLYMAHDRGDTAYAVSVLSTDFRAPTEDSWRRTKRLAR
jgi:hypothetical protein